MRTLAQINVKRITPTGLGMVFACLGVLIYAAGHSIAAVLVEIGASHPLPNGRSAITFTNLLFLGSLISVIPMVGLFRRDLTQANLRGLTRRDWGLLTASALFSSALTPGLFFFALEYSSVTNVMLVGRIEPPLFVVATAWFLKERIDTRAFKAGLVALCGAMMIIGLRDAPGQRLVGIGEIAALAATLSYIVSSILARTALRRIPMGIFSVYRTIVGTVIYVLMITLLRGPQEFQGLLSPVLWQWIWVYAGVVLVIGQLVWFMALKHARSGDISLAASFAPVASIVFAMVLLGEDPGPGLLPGGGLILLAILVGKSDALVPHRVRALWQKRPTYSPGGIAQVLVPMAAFRKATKPRYAGSY